jgi:hypothetical protein
MVVVGQVMGGKTKGGRSAYIRIEECTDHMFRANMDLAKSVSCGNMPPRRLGLFHRKPLSISYNYT